jgi:hypothetical protein
MTSPPIDRFLAKAKAGWSAWSFSRAAELSGRGRIN